MTYQMQRLLFLATRLGAVRLGLIGFSRVTFEIGGEEVPAAYWMQKVFDSGKFDENTLPVRGVPW